MKLFCLIIIVMSSPVVCQAQNSKPEVLTNKMVVDLVQAKFSADIIIKKIQTAVSVNFDIDTDALIKLKNSGVEEKIITAMLDRVALSSPVIKSGDVEINKDAIDRLGASVKVSSSEEKEKPKKFSVKAKFFTFDLERCKFSGEMITCVFMITNNDSVERKIRFPFYTRLTKIVDDKGNQYKPSVQTIPGQEDDMPSLASGITLKGTVLFEGIKSDTAAIKLLVLSFETLSIRPPRIRGMSPGTDPFQVEFRDIPLSH